MSRQLDDLDGRFRPMAMEMIARMAEAHIPILVVDTLRTPAEHTANLQNGTSWILRSKHLRGLAIDVAPFLQYELHGPDKLQWDVNDPVWLKMGVIGERLGLRWGGRWKRRDMGHFELPVSD